MNALLNSHMLLPLMNEVHSFNSAYLLLIFSFVIMLQQNRFLGTVEYIEKFFGAEAESAFDVTITGEWFLQGERNPFTGSPITAIRIDLEKVMYGSTTNQAEQWDSLGPIKFLDIIYFSPNLKILIAR
jgi:hypothetical protein